MVLSQFRAKSEKLPECQETKLDMNQKMQKKMTVLQKNHSIEKENLLMKIQRERNQ